MPRTFNTENESNRLVSFQWTKSIYICIAYAGNIWRREYFTRVCVYNTCVVVIRVVKLLFVLAAAAAAAVHDKVRARLLNNINFEAHHHHHPSPPPNSIFSLVKRTHTVRAGRCGLFIPYKLYNIVIYIYIHTRVRNSKTTVRVHCRSAAIASRAT